MSSRPHRPHVHAALKRLVIAGAACAVLLALAVVAATLLRGSGDDARPVRPPMSSPAPGRPAPSVQPETGPPEEALPEAAGPLDSAQAIQRAITRARPGDDLVIAGGTYRTSLDINRVNGTAEDPIRLRAEPGSTVRIIRGEDPYALFARNAAHWEIGSDDGRLEFDGDETAFATVGIGLYSGTSENTSNVDPGPAENITLRNVGITRSGQELLRIGHGSRDIDVVDSDLSGSGLRRSEYGEAVYLGSARGDDDVRWVRLRDVRIHDLTAEAVDVKPGVDHVELSGVHIFDIELSSTDVLNKCAIAHRSTGQLSVVDSHVQDVRRASGVSARSNEPCGIYTVGPVRIEGTVIEDTGTAALWVNNDESGVEVTVLDSEFRSNGGDTDGIVHSGAEAVWTISGSDVGSVSPSIRASTTPGEAEVSSGRS